MGRRRLHFSTNEGNKFSKSLTCSKYTRALTFENSTNEGVGGREEGGGGQGREDGEAVCMLHVQIMFICICMSVTCVCVLVCVCKYTHIYIYIYAFVCLSACLSVCLSCRKELIAREASGRVEIYGTSWRKVKENEGEQQAVALPAQACTVQKT
jgi:hypothetical protein